MAPPLEGTPARLDSKGERHGEQLGGQFDHSHNTLSCQPRRTGLPEADGMNECGQELAACLALSCHEEMREKVRALGVLRFAGNVIDPFDALCCAHVAFLPGRKFEFSKYCPIVPPRHCVIIPARDPNAEVIDLCAFDPDTKETALWRGAASMLGAENIWRSRPRLEEPLTVHRTALAFLRADREGVHILNHRRAADWLDGFTLCAEDEDHGHKLRRALTRPAPPIVVRKAQP